MQNSDIIRPTSPVLCTCRVSMLPMNTYSNPTKNMGKSSHRMFGDTISRHIFFINTFGDVFATNFRDDSPGDGFSKNIGIAPSSEITPRQMNITDAESCHPLGDG